MVGYSDGMSLARVGLLSCLSLVAAVLNAGCDRASAPAPAPVTAPVAAAPAAAAPATPPPAPVSPADYGPVHKLTALDLDGKPVPLSRFAGKPMIIEIWATWCGPCLANRRTVHGIDPALRGRVQVIGLSVDTSADLVRNYLKSNPANDFEGMASPEFLEFIRGMNASPLIPKTLYVDSKGRVADLAEGSQSDKWLSAMMKNLK
jgi:thiol-disulfide isomerase/thioredoxin